MTEGLTPEEQNYEAYMADVGNFARIDVEGKPRIGRFYDGYLAGQKDTIEANFKKVKVSGSKMTEKRIKIPDKGYVTCPVCHAKNEVTAETKVIRCSCGQWGMKFLNPAQPMTEKLDQDLLLTEDQIRQVYNSLKEHPPEWILQIDKAIANAQLAKVQPLLEELREEIHMRSEENINLVLEVDQKLKEAKQKAREELNQEIESSRTSDLV